MHKQPIDRNIQLDANQQGFVLIPSLIPSKYIQYLIEQIELLKEKRKDLVSSSQGIRDLLNQMPPIRDLANGALLMPIVQSVLGREAQVVRGLLFDKTPDANWKVPWHQDLTIAVRQKIECSGYNTWSIKANIPHVQPPLEILEQMLTIRIHLDPADETNGALSVIPRSHRLGRIPQSDISKIMMQQSRVSCNVRAGDVLIMFPLLLHASSLATYPKHRRVIHLEYCSAQLNSCLTWYES